MTNFLKHRDTAVDAVLVSSADFSFKQFRDVPTVHCVMTPNFRLTRGRSSAPRPVGCSRTLDRHENRSVRPRLHRNRTKPRFVRSRMVACSRISPLGSLTRPASRLSMFLNTGHEPYGGTFHACTVDSKDPTISPCDGTTTCPGSDIHACSKASSGKHDRVTTVRMIFLDRSSNGRRRELE